MRRRVIDADLTIPVAVTVSDADAQSESGTRRRQFAGDQPADDSKPGATASHHHARERRACWGRDCAAIEQRHLGG